MFHSLLFKRGQEEDEGKTTRTIFTQKVKVEERERVARDKLSVN
jgi:hypothetical protein